MSYGGERGVTYMRQELLEEFSVFLGRCRKTDNRTAIVGLVAVNRSPQLIHVVLEKAASWGIELVTFRGMACALTSWLFTRQGCTMLPGF